MVTVTEILAGMSPLEQAARKTKTPEQVERAAIRELVKAARARGDDLTGPDGLLKSITKQVIETALAEEMSEHLGYDKHAVEGRNHGNSRNGTRTKTVLTDNAGKVDIEVPRDRDGTFTPVIVGKRQRRLSDVDAVVISLYSRGLTTGWGCPLWGRSQRISRRCTGRRSVRTRSAGSPTRSSRT